MHAERAAIRLLHRRIHDGQIIRRQIRSGVKLISLRFSNNGVLQMAKPCQACERMIRGNALVREVAWSTDSGNLSTVRTCGPCVNS